MRRTDRRGAARRPDGAAGRGGEDGNPCLRTFCYRPALRVCRRWNPKLRLRDVAGVNGERFPACGEPAPLWRRALPGAEILPRVREPPPFRGQAFRRAFPPPFREREKARAQAAPLPRAFLQPFGERAVLRASLRLFSPLFPSPPAPFQPFPFRPFQPFRLSPFRPAPKLCVPLPAFSQPG